MAQDTHRYRHWLLHDCVCHRYAIAKISFRQWHLYSRNVMAKTCRRGPFSSLTVRCKSCSVTSGRAICESSESTVERLCCEHAGRCVRAVDLGIDFSLVASHPMPIQLNPTCNRAPSVIPVQRRMSPWQLKSTRLRRQ